MSRATAARRPPIGSRRAATWILKAAVAATAIGAAIAVFRADGSSINAFLFLDAGLSHAAAARVDRIVLSAVVGLAALSLAWPRWFLLLPVAAYFLLESLAGSHMGGYAFSQWTPAAHALRYLTPLALVLIARPVAIVFRHGDTAESQPSGSLAAGAWLLRLGLVAVFLTHGYEALQLHPKFIDLVITSGENLLGVRIDQASASAALRVIGVLDVAVAALLLVRPWPAVLAWMAIWGLITAASRMTSYGSIAHTDLLIRATHFAAPLALLLIVNRSRSLARRREAAGPPPPGADTSHGSAHTPLPAESSTERPSAAGSRQTAAGTEKPSHRRLACAAVPPMTRSAAEVKLAAAGPHMHPHKRRAACVSSGDKQRPPFVGKVA